MEVEFDPNEFVGLQIGSKELGFHVYFFCDVVKIKFYRERYKKD